MTLLYGRVEIKWKLISYERIMHKLVVINLKSSTNMMAGKKKTEHVYLAHSRSSVNIC